MLTGKQIEIASVIVAALLAVATVLAFGVLVLIDVYPLVNKS